MRSSRIAVVLACSVPLFAALASAQEATPPAPPAGSATPPAATPPAAGAAPAAPGTQPAPAPTTTSASSTPPSPAASAAPAPTDAAAPAAASAAPTPAPSPPPSTPAPTLTPASSSAPTAPPTEAAAPTSAPPSADTGTTTKKEKKKPRPETTLGVEADLGIAGRLGSSDTGYDDKEGAGPLAGGGLFFAPMKMFDIGITYQRTQLGTEDAAPTGTLFANTLYRSLNSIWGNVRTYPWRSENVGLFLGLMFGPTWESTHGTMTLPPSVAAGTVQTYSCSASGGAGLALGVTAGADFDLGGGLSFLTRLTGASYHTSSDALTDGNGNVCGPGVGSAATLDARVGFVYRFDLGGEPSTQTAVNY